MQQNGLVEVRSLKKYGRPQREVYMITPMGKRAFKQWCESPVSHFRDMRVEFLAKLYFLFQSSKQGALSLIESQKLYLDRLLARILRHNHSLTDNPTFSILAKSFRVYQIRACIEWLEECERRIKTI
jgi:DNA-binding PadR family transcriptional regulator